jgi:hypothetical protein
MGASSTIPCTKVMNLQKDQNNDDDMVYKRYTILNTQNDLVKH